jgi:hypothetical protein
LGVKCMQTMLTINIQQPYVHFTKKKYASTVSPVF